MNSTKFKKWLFHKLKIAESMTRKPFCRVTYVK